MTGPDTEPVPEPHYSGHRERLRQRFLENGEEALADYEILELLLFTALPRRDIKPLAKELLRAFGSLGCVLNASATDLARRAGLGPSSVAALKVVPAAARRMLKEAVIDRPVLSSWERVLDYLSLSMKYEQTEQFRILFLDRRNALVADEVQAKGSVDHAPVYPREIVRRALELQASALILVHNHPSGEPQPSRQDIEMTREIARATDAVGIIVHDHVVVGRKGHASFKALGLL